MTELFKCKKSGTICCAPKSRIHEVQGMMHRNDSFPVFVNPQTQQQIPQYLPNNNYPNGYQQIPPNAYAPIPNAYQPLPPQASIPNNYPIPPANNYITQPQQVPQQPIITNNYVHQVPQLNYAPVPPNNVYPQNVVITNPHVNPNVNLAPAYSTPGKSIQFFFQIK